MTDGITEASRDDEPHFYIQDSRVYCGNSVFWWGPNGGGYTTHIDQAGKYTRAEAAMRTARATDVLWPCEEVDRIWSSHVDMQHLGRLPVKGQPCGEAAPPTAKARARR